jgi:hypothetical protein
LKLNKASPLAEVISLLDTVHAKQAEDATSCVFEFCSILKLMIVSLQLKLPSSQLRLNSLQPKPTSKLKEQHTKPEEMLLSHSVRY